jgi:hypothetical protein
VERPKIAESTKGGTKSETACGAEEKQGEEDVIA